MSLRIENLIEYPDVHIFLGTATILMICIDLQHLIVRLDHHNKLWRALSIIMRRMFVYVCVIHSVIDTACIRWSISWFPRSCWNADPNRRANIHGDFFSTNSQSQLPDHVWLSNLNSTNSHCWSGNLHRLNHHWGHPVGPRWPCSLSFALAGTFWTSWIRRRCSWDDANEIRFSVQKSSPLGWNDG